MLEGLEPKSKDRLCILVSKAQKELSESDQKILFDAIADEDKWSGNALSTALRDRGFAVHKNAVRDHRRGECPCAR
jgi:hypothetical protein